MEPHDPREEEIHKHHQNHGFSAQAWIKASVLIGNGSESEFLSKMIPKKEVRITLPSLLEPHAKMRYLPVAKEEESPACIIARHKPL